MHRRLLPQLFLLLLLISAAAAPAQTTSGRVKVALLDGEPVYHWTQFQSVRANDIDRALILRAFRREGYTLPPRYIDKEINYIVKTFFGGDRQKLLDALKRAHETLDDLRKFTAEELIIKALCEYVTVKGRYGEAPIPEAKWLASLRKGAQVQMTR